MSRAVADARHELVDTALRRAVAEHLRGQRAATSIRRRRCEYASSYASQVVTIGLADGADRAEFLRGQLKGRDALA